MSDYHIFANYYDRLMYDLDYDKTCAYVLSLAEKYGVSAPGLAVDLGCGTGTMCRAFAKAGFDMIGIDLDEEMLQIAREQSVSEDADDDTQNILYLQQDMTDFELYGTVSMITCLTDGVNHVTDARKLRRMFYWAHNYLDYDGVFIFDINAPEKLSQTLGNNVFYQVSDEVSYIWQCTYHPKSRICDFDLTFFLQEADGRYRKEEAFIREKAYEVAELKAWLKEAGFVRIRTFRKGQRIYFACARESGPEE